MDFERDPFKAGDWLVQPTLNRLERDGKSTTVESRTMAVLVYLAQHAGEVVSSDDLKAHVWDGKIVGDKSVSNTVAMLQRALGDDSRDPRYLQIIPKKGCRLVCEITTAEPKPVAEHPEPPSSGNSFVAELGRRGILRVAMAYGVASWLVVQVAQVTFEPFGIPMWVMRLLIIMVVVGFPIAMFFSWTLQLTPQGVVRDKPYSGQSKSGNARTTDIVLLSLLLVAFGVIIFGQLFKEKSTESDEVPIAKEIAEEPPLAPAFSIAVLPFENLSKYPENAFFADGLAEEMLNLLSQVQWLDVAARTSSFYFKDKDVDLPTIAQSLRVHYVIEGSVRREGEKIRVTAQLIDATTGYHRWSASYDRGLVDLFAIQSEIATAIVNSLELLLSAEKQGGYLSNVLVAPSATIDYRPTDSVDAYVFYLQGRDYLRRPKEAINLESSERLFLHAIDVDPKYARAYAGLCETYLTRYTQTSTVALFDEAERACQRALALDETLTEVHVALGALYRESGEYDKSLEELLHVPKTDSRAVDALIELGNTYSARNELVAAEDAFRQAVALKPGYWAAFSGLANFLYTYGRYTEAATYWTTVTELTPDSSRGFSNLGSAYYMLDDFESAASAWERSLELHTSRLTYTNLGLSYYYLGRFEDAAHMQQRAIELAPDDHRVWGRLAESYRFVSGQEASSQTAYKKAIELAQVKIKINPKDWNTTAHLGLYHAYTGDAKKALMMIAQAHRLSPENFDVYYLEALVSNALGNLAETFEALEQALDLGYSERLITSDPDLKPLLETARMKALLSRSRDTLK